MSDTRVWALAAAAMLAVPASASAQVRASELATVSQTVDGTTITVDYSRPRTRGRSPIYGKIVAWGEVWTPGANWATTLDVSNDVAINGHRVPKGKYSVWMQVEQGDWTVILDPKAKQFHTAHPKPDSTQVRFAVTPDSSVGPDLLTWSFPVIGPTGATLQFAWAGRTVPLKVEVTPSHPATLAADLASRYVGNYAFAWVPDTTGAEAMDSTMAKPSVWKVSYTNGMLLVDWVPPPFEEWSRLVLIKIGDNWFNPGAMVDGELFDVVNDLVIEFPLKNGKAIGFEIRSEKDEVIGNGVRTK